MAKKKEPEPVASERNIVVDLDELLLVVYEADTYVHAAALLFTRIAWDGESTDRLRDLGRVDSLMCTAEATIARLIKDTRAVLQAANAQRVAARTVVA
jgi:hypothetical protein